MLVVSEIFRKSRIMPGGVGSLFIHTVLCLFFPFIAIMANIYFWLSKRR